LGANTLHFLLLYKVLDDYTVRREPFRAEHLALAHEFHRRGILELGGALDQPVDMAVLLFRCDSQDPIEEFIQRDPYVRNGLIASWQIRRWITVVGDTAQSPINPKDLT
jgi:uncharacterized protein YciI